MCFSCFGIPMFYLYILWTFYVRFTYPYLAMLKLETEWQQVSRVLQNSSQYSDRSKKNAVVWIVSILPLIPIFPVSFPGLSRPFCAHHLQLVLASCSTAFLIPWRDPTFWSFFSISLFFILWSSRTANSLSLFLVLSFKYNLVWSFVVFFCFLANSKYFSFFFFFFAFYYVYLMVCRNSKSTRW